MGKTQLILSASGIALIFIIYRLPRVVVENDQLQEVTPAEMHSLEIPEKVRVMMTELRKLIPEEKDPAKKTNLAFSLATLYLDYGVYDSAVTIGEHMEKEGMRPSLFAMEIYYKAFERTGNKTDSRVYALKAGEILKQLIDEDPGDLMLKNKLAMTMAVGEDPMKGVALLREILELEENNRQAILNLGLLAIQSSQFSRARERFKKLVSLDSSDFEAKLYLAVALIELNKQLKARSLLEEIIHAADSIPAIKMMAMDYLNEL